MSTKKTLTRSQMVGMIATLRGILYDHINLMQDTVADPEEISEMQQLAEDTGGFGYRKGDLLEHSDGNGTYDVSWDTRKTYKDD